MSDRIDAEEVFEELLKNPKAKAAYDEMGDEIRQHWETKKSGMVDSSEFFKRQLQNPEVLAGMAKAERDIASYEKNRAGTGGTGPPCRTRWRMARTRTIWASS